MPPRISPMGLALTLIVCSPHMELGGSRLNKSLRHGAPSSLP